MLSYPHKLRNLPVVQETCRYGCGCVGDTVRERSERSLREMKCGGGEGDDTLHSHPQALHTKKENKTHPLPITRAN